LHKRAEITQLLLICLGLAALTIAAFWPVTRADFVNLDDPTYVAANLRVQQGLTSENVKWAFSTFYFSNWHPLTWLSYMLDCEMFGASPRAMHCVNLAWHVANVLLLFGLLKRATAATWPSALVAALFAVHPLHVESVAWIAERKDVLSTFCWISSMWAYCEYVKARCAGWYTAAVALCALGLMCKAMLVTLPFALLLFDVWPLRRFEPGVPGRTRRLAWLSIEKLPFFVLIVVTAYLTFIAQRAGESVVTFEPLSLSQRIENAVISYARYLGKTVWPSDLAPFYPHPVEWPALQIILSLLLVLGASAGAAYSIRRQPSVFTGWFWFVGTLVPVIGLVQVGGQSIADRYTYVPSIGLFLGFVWIARSIATKMPFAVGTALSTAVLLVLASFTYQQSQHWHNSLALFTHAARVTRPNAVVFNNLGAALQAAGRAAESDAAFRQALEVDPDDPWALGNVGNALLRAGKLDEALLKYRKALGVKPNIPQLHLNAGLALYRKSEFTHALQHYERALQLQPFYVEAYVNAGNALMALGQPAAAATNYARVVQLTPSNAGAHYNLGHVAVAQGQAQQAAEHFATAIRLDPKYVEAHLQLGLLRQRLGQFDHARRSIERALALRPADAAIHAHLGALFVQSGHPKEAIQAYRKAIEVNPQMFEAPNNLAWLLATYPDAEIRNDAEAVQLAERAVELGRRQHAFLLGTLAAAYAEAGRFADAIKAAEEAIQLAEKNGQENLAAINRELLVHYREGRPWREDPGSTLPNK
jgi:protein O-mannosyl-transferase